MARTCRNTLNDIDSDEQDENDILTLPQKSNLKLLKNNFVMNEQEKAKQIPTHKGKDKVPKLQ